MFMAVTMESERITKNNFNSIANTADFTLKQMFDISAKLVSEQEYISGFETIGWENHSWKYLSLIGDERIINLQRTNLYVFSDSVLCLGKIHQNPESNEVWKKRIEWITFFQAAETLTESMESRRNSSGTFSQHWTRCSSTTKSKVY